MCKSFPITVCYFGNFLYSNLPVTILLRVSAINFLILILFSRFNFDTFFFFFATSSFSHRHRRLHFRCFAFLVVHIFA